MSERISRRSTNQKNHRPVRNYLKPNRLADVLALIQALALHPTQTHRRDENLFQDLGGAPRSCSSWYEVAANHPEFFRVSWPRRDYVPVPDLPELSGEEITELDSPVPDDNRWPISLLVRHLSPRELEVAGDENLRIAPLKIEAIQPLLKLAIDMHEQQEKAWTKWVAVAGTVAAALIAAFAAMTLASKAASPVLNEPRVREGAAQQVAPLAPSANQAAPKTNADK